ncbi:cupin domain-containing protein [Microvirga sp. VF16]|uniref:cupin domain-containing protein n=1 Tax=Microvirga sp. VF16 TaxID=2807101 RepID=UPI00193E08FC|nr:cupin domain-containing protein [Microvirga sp. VF16]QRM36050.1 cupin domain-containing protein [Microvirga sp. VF16]
MRILDEEIGKVHLVQPPAKPNYDEKNPIGKLLAMVEGVALAAGREHYLADHLQYLFPISTVELYGPSGDQWQVRDPRQQDNRNDFQKQNVRDFTLQGIEIVRGYAAIGNWIGSFINIAYFPKPGSPLLNPDGTYRANSVKLYLKVGDKAGTEPITVPLNEEMHRFQVELWAVDDPAMLDGLDEKGKASLKNGTLLARPDLVKGTYDQLYGHSFNGIRQEALKQDQGVGMLDYVPDHTMHPVRPLRLEMAWGSEDGERWDSREGTNYRFEFAMSQRGWNHYLGVGKSRNPHGGLKGLEFRNLYSNYFGYEGRRQAIFGGNTLSELGRELPDWSFDADGNRPPGVKREAFMTVDYMDLHILEPNAVIGIHRHRDNQEAFLVMEGKALMVIGDWAERKERQRAFEIRTMRPGDISLVKGGQMHALANSLDENVLLFMFGGYD